MEQTQTRLINLPVIGRVQHGEKLKNKVTEYGYFIAKSDDAYMKKFLDKFDEEYKGKQNIEIEFFDEEPLSIKYARYNQGGEACRCSRESNQATLKVKNGWKQIECDKFGCEYRQKDANGKRACNRIGWLKFFIPSISTDRIFLMKITGQQSISKLDDYIKLQKLQGKSVKGKYTIFLKKSEKPNSLGQTYTNYVLDLFKNEDFYSENTTLENASNISQEQLSTKPIQNVKNEDETTGNNEITSTNIKNSESKAEKKEPDEKQVKTKTTKASKIVKQEKATSKKENSTKESKEEKNPKIETTNKPKNNKTEGKFSWDNIYLLFETFREKVKTKNGEKDYLIARFYDVNDQKYDVIINPNDEERIKKCNLGAAVKLELKNFGERLCAMRMEIFDEQQKIAA